MGLVYVGRCHSEICFGRRRLYTDVDPTRRSLCGICNAKLSWEEREVDSCGSVPNVDPLTANKHVHEHAEPDRSPNEGTEGEFVEKPEPLNWAETKCCLYHHSTAHQNAAVFTCDSAGRAYNIRQTSLAKHHAHRVR
jgi:hypothetical protein